MTRSTVMQSALTRALKGVVLAPEDAAAVALARRYARGIDQDVSMLWRLGPRLLQVLVELQMTPRARAALLEEGTSGGSAEPGEPADPREAALAALAGEHVERSR